MELELLLVTIIKLRNIFFIATPGCEDVGVGENIFEESLKGTATGTHLHHSCECSQFLKQCHYPHGPILGKLQL